MTGAVKVESGGGRRATGDQAVLLQRNASLTLTGKDGAELIDQQGLRLLSPRFVLYRDKSLLLADGPGKLFIAGVAAAHARSGLGLGTAPVATDDLPGSQKVDYSLTFGKRMIYSFTDRRLLFEEAVELRQLTLYGKCDKLEALLTVDESRRSEDPETQGLTLGSAICTGNVFFRRYEPPRDKESLEEVIRMGASTERLGHTALVWCEKSIFDVENRRVTFYDSPQSAVRILEQDVKAGEAPVRRYFYDVERAILNGQTGDVSFPHGARNPKVKFLSGDGPLRLPE